MTIGGDADAWLPDAWEIDSGHGRSGDYRIRMCAVVRSAHSGNVHSSQNRSPRAPFFTSSSRCHWATMAVAGPSQ